MRIRGMYRSYVQAAVLAAGLCGSLAQAAVVVDGTLRAPLALEGPAYQVTPNLGLRRGPNLFFSFSRFNLAAGDSATFSGPDSVSRIISRVTAGGPSSINGLIRSTIAGADFYFINPAGVVLGAGATVDVSGSFYVSTAQYLKLGDGARFDAVNPSGNTLTSAPPEAFGFLGGQGAIKIGGTAMRPDAGVGLTFVGGDIDIGRAKISTTGAGIRVAATRSAGEVAVAGAASTAPFDGDVLLHDGNIIGSDASASAPPGALLIQGGRVVIDNTQLYSHNEFDAAAGDVTITASQSLTMLNGGGVYTDTCDYGVDGCGTGDGASVFISSPIISLAGPSSLTTNSFGPGDGGDIVLNASDSISIVGLGADGDPNFRTIAAATFGTGAGGEVHVTTSDLDLDHSGHIITYSCGSNCFGTPLTYVYGKGGDVFVDADRISLRDLSTISAATFGEGQGGNLAINARESLTIVGVEQGSFTGLSPNTSGSGNAGTLTLNTPLLRADDFGQIISYTAGSGNAGVVNIDADVIEINSNAQILNASFDSGNSGELHITAHDSVTITGDGGDVDFNSGIAGETYSTGAGAVITIDTPKLTLTQGGIISASAFSDGPAGSIHVEADDILLDHHSQIAASNYSSGQGSGDVGEITLIAHNSLILTGSDEVNLSSVLLLNFGSGSGGTLRIDTPYLLVDPRNEVSAATYESGSGGSIHINAETVELNGGIISVESLGSGNAGSIHVESNDILIDHQAQILASNSSGAKEGQSPSPGNVGEITLIAHDSLVVTGSDDTRSSSVLLLNFGTGSGGTLNVETPHLVIDPRSVISAGTYDSGSGGSIHVNADNVELNGGVITAESLGSGNAGSIQLAVTDTLLMNAGSAINTTTVQSDGGNIDLQVGNLLFVNDSSISTSVAGDLGNGGNISIDPRFVVLRDSDITANAFGGNGGNISIVADHFLPSADSSVQASSQLGIDGTINIASPVVDVGEALGRLSTDYVDASRALHNSCASGVSGASNSFIALGRGGLRPGTAGPQYAPLALLLPVAVAPQTVTLASLSDLGPASCMAVAN